MTEKLDKTFNDDKWLKTTISEWADHRNELISKATSENSAIALAISSEEELRLNPNDLNEIQMVIIEFTTLIDGRGFSLAAILREKYRFKGGIRAANVLEDNIAYLEECGFDSFELESGKIYYPTRDANNSDLSPVGFAQRLNRLKFS